MTAGRDLDAVIAHVREQVDPGPDERAALDAAVQAVVARTEAAIADREVTATVVHVGSTARGTWVSGDRDIDVFVQFDPDLPREDLERFGLQIGREVLPDGHTEYAEHPYVTGEYEGFAVDLVPCYAVADATAIKSAVDRTPFHNAYLSDRIDPDLAGEVRVFKQFLKGIGAYGSDLRTRGYSGYVAELLVLEYGGFEATLRAVRDWRLPVRLDPAAHGEQTFEDQLVVIDPTDPHRNVAAVVSETNVARLIHYARALLADPATGYFEPTDRNPMDAAAVRSAVEARGTTPIAVAFDPPGLVDDQLYPQLRRSLAGLVRGLENADFEVLRSETWAHDRAVLFVELSVADRPLIERHEGPPVDAAEHATRFFETYADAGVTGPFIDGGRYVVERERETPSAAAFVRENLLDVALGARIEPALKEGYSVYTGAEIASLVPEFGAELGAYFRPDP